MGTAHDAELRITGPVTEGHTVPAEVLVQALQGLQRLVLLLAASREHLTIHKRFIPSAAFRERYTLHCAIPEAGSYVIPLAMADDSYAVLGDLYTFWSALAGRDFERLRQLSPNPALQHQVQRTAEYFLPWHVSPWGLAYSVKGRQEVELGPPSWRELQQAWSEEELKPSGKPSLPREWREGELRSPERPEQAQAPSLVEEQHEATSVIGRLVRVDFVESKIVLLYAPTLREIDCVYRPDMEERILKGRHGLFQVTGYFALDSERHPKQLLKMSDLGPVDLSPMSFSSLKHGKKEYLLRPPLQLTPSLDEESQQNFVLEYPPLRLHVHARTRSALVDELGGQMDFLWQEYADADPSTLAEDALQLREMLRERVSRQHG